MCFGVLVCRHTVWYHSLQVSHWMAPCLLVHVLIQIWHLDDTGPGLSSFSPERSKIKIKCFCLYLHILCFHCLKVILLYLPTRLKVISFKQWKHKICRYRQKHLFLILLLSGDIELNPGPVSSKCQICIKACTSKQGTIQCDTCNEWYHIACLHANTPKHIAIGLRNKYASWHCIHCGLPQISSDLFNYKDLITTNSYSVLANPFINKPLDKMKPTTQTHKITHKKSNNNNNQNILKTLIVNFQSLKKIKFQI